MPKQIPHTPRNVFISYSHQDDEHKRALETHLAPLLKRNLLKLWSDSTILAGERLHDHINTALRECEVFISLLSASYVQSNYCYDIELEEAMRRYELQTCLVVPILVRSVNFSGLPIEQLKILPVDAKPITSFTNSDDGWKNVVEEIEKLLQSPDYRVPHVKKHMREWTNDTEVSYLSNDSKSALNLDELYVFPDLWAHEEKLTARTSFTPSAEVHTNNTHCLFVCEEQSGKTAFCRRYFARLSEEGAYYPVYIDGHTITNSDFPALFGTALAEQYSIAPSLNSCVPLIDELDSSDLSIEELQQVAHFILGTFSRSIVIVTDAFNLRSNVSTLDEFSAFDLLPLGNYLREQLIANWLRARGTAVGLEEERFLQTQVEPKKRDIDTFVQRNIVPSKAIYILSILQASEKLAPHSFELTAHGHCYQHLILDALRGANTRLESLDSYINYLTELSLEIFQKGGKGLGDAELRDFNHKYEQRFHSPEPARAMVEHLVRCRILAHAHGMHRFRYRYIYYFCVGKAVAEKISDNDPHDTFAPLMEELHIEDNANIAIFIAHHSKDSSILDDIEFNLLNSYSEENPTNLVVSDVAFLEKLTKEVPRLVYEQRDYREERRRLAQSADDAERNEEQATKEVETREADDPLVRLHHALRSMEISGQIVRNRVGSLHRDRLKSITQETIDCGLRLLRFFLNSTGAIRDELLEHLTKLLAQDTRLKRESLEKHASKYIYFLMYSVILGVLRRISHAAGSVEVAKIFREIESESDDSPAFTLLAACVELTYVTSIDIDRLKERYESLQYNVLAQRLFQELVVSRLYLYPVEYKKYKTKQQIASAFGIPVQLQRSIEHRRETKR